MLFKEALQGPSDLMVCFGTFHRLHNINNSINAKIVTHNKSLRSLIGECASYEMKSIFYTYIFAVFIFLSYLISLAAYAPSFFQYEDIEGR